MIILIENIELLGGSVLFEEFARHFPLGGQDNTITGQNTNSGAGVRDCFQCIFYLI